MLSNQDQSVLASPKSAMTEPFSAVSEEITGNPPVISFICDPVAQTNTPIAEASPARLISIHPRFKKTNSSLTHKSPAWHSRLSAFRLDILSGRENLSVGADIGLWEEIKSPIWQLARMKPIEQHYCQDTAP